MKGWFRVDAESISTKRAIEPWAMQSVAFARVAGEGEEVSLSDRRAITEGEAKPGERLPRPRISRVVAGQDDDRLHPVPEP
jgi:hypothetical protein